MIRKKTKNLFTIIVIAAIAFVVLWAGYLLSRNGLDHKVGSDELYYFKHGFVNEDVTGIAKNEEGYWYVQNGKVDQTYTGLAKRSFGWYRVEHGKLNLKYTGFVEDGMFCWYLKNGKVRFNYSGLIYGSVFEKEGWWNVEHGQVIFRDGLVDAKRGWWYLEDGRVKLSYEGFAENEKGKWYLTGGNIDFTRRGVMVREDGTYILKKGRVEEEILRDEIRFIAHRGLNREAPENTLRAFIQAGEAGFWGCETDVRETADGRFILMHNKTFWRFCKLLVRPSEMTYDEIQQLKMILPERFAECEGDPLATRVPSLEEYLEVCKSYEMVPVIDIKDWSTGEMEEDMVRMRALYEATRSVLPEEEVIFITFDYNLLTYLQQIAQESEDTTMVLQYLTKDPKDENIEACKTAGMELNMDQECLDAEILQQLKDQGLKVNLWTVNRARQVIDWNQAGADYITTDKRYWQ